MAYREVLENVGRERVGNDVLNMGRFNLTLALAGVWQSLTIYISAHSSPNCWVQSPQNQVFREYK